MGEEKTTITDIDGLLQAIPFAISNGQVSFLVDVININIPEELREIIITSLDNAVINAARRGRIDELVIACTRPEVTEEAKENAEKILIRIAGDLSKQGETMYFVSVLRESGISEVLRAALVDLLPATIINADVHRGAYTVLEVIGDTGIPEELQVSAFSVAASNMEPETLVGFVGKPGIPATVQLEAIGIAKKENMVSKTLHAIGNDDSPEAVQTAVVQAAAERGWVSDVLRAIDDGQVPSKTKEIAGKLLPKSVKVARKKGYVSELLSIVGNENVPKNITKKLPEIFFDAIEAARSQAWASQVLEIIGKEGMPEAVQKRAAEVALKKDLRAEPHVLQQESNNPEIAEEKKDEKVDSAADLKAAIRNGKLPDIINELDDYLSHFTKNGKDDGKIDVPEDVKEFQRIAKEVRDKKRWNGEVLEIIGKNGISEEIQKRAAEVALEKGLVDVPLKVKPEKVPESVVARVEELTEDWNKIFGKIHASEKQSAGFAKGKNKVVASKYYLSNLLTMRDIMHVLYVFGIVEKEDVDNVRAAITECLPGAVKQAVSHGKYSLLHGLVGRKDIPEEAQVLAIRGIAGNGDVAKILKVLQDENALMTVKESAGNALPIAMRSAVKKGRIIDVVELIGKPNVPESAQVLAVKIAVEEGYDKRAGELIERDDVPEKAKEMFNKLRKKGEDLALSVKKGAARSVQAIPSGNTVKFMGLPEIIKIMDDKEVPEGMRKEAVGNLSSAAKGSAKAGQVSELINLIGKPWVPWHVQSFAANAALKAQRTAEVVEKIGCVADANAQVKLMKMVLGQKQGFGGYVGKAYRGIKRLFVHVPNRNGFPQSSLNVIGKEGACEKVQALVVKTAAKSGDISSVFEMIGKSKVPDRIVMIALNLAKKYGHVAGVISLVESKEGKGMIADKAKKALPRTIRNAGKKGKLAEVLSVLENKENVPEEAVLIAKEMLPKAIRNASLRYWNREILAIVGREDVPEKIQILAIEETALTWGKTEAVVQMLWDDAISDPVKARISELISKQGYVKEILMVAGSEELSDDLKQSAKSCLQDAVESAGLKRDFKQLFAVIGNAHADEGLQIAALKNAVLYGQISEALEAVIGANPPERVQTVFLELAEAEGFGEKVQKRIKRNNVPETFKQLVYAKLKNPLENDGVLSVGRIKPPEAGKRIGSAHKIPT